MLYLHTLLSRATMPFALLVICQWATFCLPAFLPSSPSYCLPCLQVYLMIAASIALLALWPCIVDLLPVCWIFSFHLTVMPPLVPPLGSGP
jgi:hypothetical protein